MLDCGLDVGKAGRERVPDLARLGVPLSDLSCVVVTHFHVDHCGALPFLLQHAEFRGPIYATRPTIELMMVVMQDYLRTQPADARPKLSQSLLRAIPDRCVSIDYDAVTCLHGGATMRLFPAGHVLGSALVHLAFGAPSLSAVYTGDFNATSTRILAEASIPCLQPDVLITESTFATTERDGLAAREAELLHHVHRALGRGGKVLIPTFALGRAQELCLLLEQSWAAVGLDYPIYYTTGVIEQGVAAFQRLSGEGAEGGGGGSGCGSGGGGAWVRAASALSGRDPLRFRFVRPFRWAHATSPHPMVVLAAPALMQSGASLDLFKLWASDPRNLVLLPGDSVPGTLGADLLSGRREVRVGTDAIPVQCDCRSVSFSAHTDASGILRIVRQLQPRHVLLVHGEHAKMVHLQSRIRDELGLPCDVPGLHQEVIVHGAEVEQAAVAASGPPSARSAAERTSSPAKRRRLGEREGIAGVACHTADSSASGSSSVVLHLPLPARLAALPPGQLGSVVRRQLERDVRLHCVAQGVTADSGRGEGGVAIVVCDRGGGGGHGAAALVEVCGARIRIRPHDGSDAKAAAPHLVFAVRDALTRQL